ncbi:alpha/beta hydrolase family protein [Massilia glaciei]|uniref:S9 family peptidase n=1 Tax=Massilia glaciei TaxID=1524097 RepID=A0A2U2HF30_9BURK|nr:prolyl oligopeptidase family serine peptidase [Massilia glaciei]PWF42501.1 S9 family peptidase [Massilia glaciei]
MIKSTSIRRPLALLLVAACAGLGVSSALAAPATPLPIESFFKKPAVGAPTLSPSGKKIAMLVPTKSGRMGLAVADVATPDKFTGIAQFDDADVGSVFWVNDERLVFGLVDFQAGVGDQLGSGLYAVNADGSDFLWLIHRTSNLRVMGNPVKPPLPARYQFVGPARDGSDDVIVKRWIPTAQGKPSTSMMMRLNTKTLTPRSIYTADVPDGIQDWVLDRNLQPRVVITTAGKSEATVHWREEGGTTWSELFRVNYIEDLNATTPVAVDRNGVLYVSATNPASAEGTKALYRYDVKQRKIEDKPLVNLPGFDFDGNVLFDSETKEMLGVTYVQETDGVVWFDKKLRDIQEAVDKLLPNTNNYVNCSRCSSARHLMVTSTSDIQAPVFFLFDTQTGKLTLVGQSYPWLQSTDMAGTQDFQRIKARDGTSIPVYITKPKGKGPFPTVVLVHGGPFVRGNEWGFNRANQFLASRGYVVIEPEFRGSKGYGSKLFRAGWKQWGLGMQDDVTDATKWAIAQGLADPNRIAIAGASYGGYATMMGLLKEPELYKAGINWVGVTDIELMYTIGWSDFMDADNAWAKYGMPTMIGDPKTDKAQLTATSPLQQAARIKQPVLMAYGEEDYRVPMPHGTKMRDALIASGNKNVEFVSYPSEGHNWMLTKTTVDFWSRVERFLAKNLK